MAGAPADAKRRRLLLAGGGGPQGRGCRQAVDPGRLPTTLAMHFATGTFRLRLAAVAPWRERTGAELAVGGQVKWVILAGDGWIGAGKTVPVWVLAHYAVATRLTHPAGVAFHRGSRQLPGRLVRRPSCRPPSPRWFPWRRYGPQRRACWGARARPAGASCHQRVCQPGSSFTAPTAVASGGHGAFGCRKATCDSASWEPFRACGSSLTRATGRMGSRPALLPLHLAPPLP